MALVSSLSGNRWAKPLPANLKKSDPQRTFLGKTRNS
jgi:hypothetical protein